MFNCQVRITRKDPERGQHDIPAELRHTHLLVLKIIWKINSFLLSQNLKYNYEIQQPDKSHMQKDPSWSEAPTIDYFHVLPGMICFISLSTFISTYCLAVFVFKHLDTYLPVRFWCLFWFFDWVEIWVRLKKIVFLRLMWGFIWQKPNDLCNRNCTCQFDHDSIFDNGSFFKLEIFLQTFFCKFRSLFLEWKV